MTTRRAPIEVLEALAEAALEVDRIAGRAAVYGGGELGTALQALHKAEDAYRAATSPLRTRQEVDAEIGTTPAPVLRSGNVERLSVP